MHRSPLLSITIKTYNEAEKIALAIESALAAAKEIPGPVEIVIADSLSTDQTVEIASRYPVRVVQFANRQDCGCGAGVQLGYQHSSGAFVYILDGDMEMLPGFLGAAYRTMAEDGKIGGVAGLLEDTQVVNQMDRYRKKNKASSHPGELACLNGGGLYRREAIEAAGGYAANRNLKAYEEADLGFRLGAKGWKLLRLPIPAVRHTGHSVGTIELLRRHWRSRRAMAAGVLLRAAAGQPWWRGPVRILIHPLALTAWWLMLIAALAAGLSGVAIGLVAILAAVLVALAYKKRDPAHAATSLMLWHYAAAGILAGFCYRQIPPETPIASRLLHEPDQTDTAASR